MKANNLTICINANCSKGCQYCISRMTFYPKSNSALFYRNIRKAVNVAQLASVSSILLTSKGEPLNNIETIMYCLNKFKDFPLELQTNGLLLTSDILKQLYDNHLNTLAISIDTYEDIKKFHEIYSICTEYGINIRLTIVLTDLWNTKFFPDISYLCNLYKIKQITFRKATVPKILNGSTDALIVSDWIRDNTKNDHNYLLDSIQDLCTKKNLIRNLSFGSSVYQIFGIAVTIINYCIQESNNTDDIRSLIYHQDGHMYTSWDKLSSNIF